jgi:hypothetical protein
MRLKAFLSLAFALLFSTVASATPILYTFTNRSAFTLDGTSYPVTPLVQAKSGLALSFLGDTDNIVLSSDFYTDSTNGPLLFTANRIGTGFVSYHGTELATISDPVEVVYDYHNIVFLVDKSTGAILMNFSSGGGSYPGFSTLDTSLGPLVITGAFSSGDTFSTTLLPASVPEPTSLILLGTGALGVFRVVRRRSSAA